MRRLAVLTLVLLFASPVAAQQKRIEVVAPTAKAAGLRPSEPAAEAPALDFSIPGGGQALPASLAFTRPLDSTASGSRATRNASQCRTACAQSHYFCLAEEEEISCNPRWARCVAGCS